MRGSSRKPVNKRKSVGQFRHKSGRAHVANVRQAPQRGGWRL